ncbi:MAG: class I SAM-dependent methyltransferase [Pyrinomonadaceae bacterium]|nr:class I SAM-dependent methyltransferase [Pyrinomonadaceae bacterium]
MYGVDQNAEAVAQVGCLASSLNPAIPAENFLVSEVEVMPFPGQRFDAVLSSAVLHFARDEKHFHRREHCVQQNLII